jgi:hypothetical protein
MDNFYEWLQVSGALNEEWCEHLVWRDIISSGRLALLEYIDSSKGPSCSHVIGKANRPSCLEPSPVLQFSGRHYWHWRAVAPVNKDVPPSPFPSLSSFSCVSCSGGRGVDGLIGLLQGRTSLLAIGSVTPMVFSSWPVAVSSLVACILLLMATCTWLASSVAYEAAWSSASKVGFGPHTFPPLFLEPEHLGLVAQPLWLPTVAWRSLLNTLGTNPPYRQARAYAPVSADDHHYNPSLHGWLEKKLSFCDCVCPGPLKKVLVAWWAIWDIMY